MQKLITAKHALAAKATAYTAAFAAQAAVRRAQLTLLQKGALDEEDAPLVIVKANSRRKAKRSRTRRL